MVPNRKTSHLLMVLWCGPLGSLVSCASRERTKVPGVHHKTVFLPTNQFHGGVELMNDYYKRLRVQNVELRKSLISIQAENEKIRAENKALKEKFSPGFPQKLQDALDKAHAHNAKLEAALRREGEYRYNYEHRLALAQKSLRVAYELRNREIASAKKVRGMLQDMVELLADKKGVRPPKTMSGVYRAYRELMEVLESEKTQK